MSKTSTDGTVYMLKIVQDHLAQQLVRLADLEVATKLTVSVAYGPTEKVNGVRTRKEHSVTLNESDICNTEYGSFPGTEYTLPDGTKGYKTFADEKKSRLHSLNRAIEGMRSDVAFLNRKLTEYKEIA